MLPDGSEFDRECPYEERARVAAIVDWSGVTDVADLLAGEHARDFARRWFAGVRDPEDLARRLSPVNRVRAGVPPILVLHGDADDVVPYAQGERLVQALRAAGARAELVTLRDEKHGLYAPAAAQAAYARVFAFLREAGVSP
jgi:dipeptidyl aminopeptidase/acylaminoacyl peptidase